MRTVAIGEGKRLKLTRDQKSRLQDFLISDHKKAIDGRSGWENIIKASLRAYQGVPPEKSGWVPFENAPVVEVPIAAEDTDAIIGQVEDLIFSLNPPVLARSRKKDFDDAAEATQDLITVEVDAQRGGWNFEAGIKEAILDWAQMGTCVGYVPYTKTIRKTDIREVTSFGPKIYCIDPTDFIFPGNSSKDVQAMKFCTMRMTMSPKELNLSARLNNWTVDDAGATDSQSAVRSERLRAAGIGSGGPSAKPPITIGDTFCYFDIDDDGVDEDLEIIWNMTSGNVLKVMYNRYDCRPFVLECYQDRAHLAYGIGVIEMELPLERMVTEVWNNHIWNMMIANTKVMTGPSSAIQEATNIYPGAFIQCDDGKVEALNMGEVNSTAINAVGILTQMAKSRVGTTNLNAPLKAGNRTPAGSMQAMLQSANRRFTHPFNNMRNFAAKCVIQCLYRLQEQVRGGNEDVVELLHKLMSEKADKIIELFKHDEWELTDALDVQLVAASVSVNRQADIQNLTQLASQVAPLYYNVMKELVGFKAHPPFPGADKLADQAAEVFNTLWHKILKGFDQISDVRSMTIDLEQIQPVMAQMGMEQVPGQMAGMLNGMGGGPQGPMQ